MSTFKQNLEATQQVVAAVLAFRKAIKPGDMVTIRDVDGVHRVARVESDGRISCVKQSATARTRAVGAGALPNDFGPGRYYTADRLYPAAL